MYIKAMSYSQWHKVNCSNLKKTLSSLALRYIHCYILINTYPPHIRTVHVTVNLYYNIIIYTCMQSITILIGLAE